MQELIFDIVKESIAYAATKLAVIICFAVGAVEVKRNKVVFRDFLCRDAL